MICYLQLFSAHFTEKEEMLIHHFFPKDISGEPMPPKQDNGEDQEKDQERIGEKQVLKGDRTSSSSF